MKLCTLGAVLCAHLVAAQAATVLIDSQQGSYLTPGRSSQGTNAQLGGVVSALTGLHPGGDIDPATSRDIATVVKSNPLKKPSALLSLTVAGLQPEDVEVPSKNQHTLTGAEHDGQGITQVLAGLIAQNPDLALLHLEELAPQACQGGTQDCLHQLLANTASLLGGSFDGSKLVLGDMQLDLQQPENKLFATELASVATGLQQALIQLQAGSTPQDVAVMDATILGLQGLRKAQGADSQQLSASKAAVQRLLIWTSQQLDAAFDGDAVMQVSVFEGVPGADSPDTAVWWKQHRRRHLNEQQVAANSTFPGSLDEQKVLARKFSSKAAAYGGFILMLYFLLGGVYCLCNMPFKRDSLLYGSKKTD